MQKYKMTIEYDGTNMFGFQKQGNLPTIQFCIENAIYKMTGENVKIVAAGRTDAGVHATCQVIDFDIKKNLKNRELLFGLNYHLKGENITVVNIKKAKNDFSARFSAKQRQYKYIITNRISPPAIDRMYTWHISKKLDILKMQTAANNLIGTNDLSSFRSSQCQSNSPIKTIDYIKFRKRKNNKIEFEIHAQSFLHHQVRNIIGTLRDVGISKISVDDFVKILKSKNRKNAGITAPSCGLFLVKVVY